VMTWTHVLIGCLLYLAVGIDVLLWLEHRR
jgi:hypothetical protein